MATCFGLSLDHLGQRSYVKIHSVPTVYCGIPYYLQGVRGNN